MLDIEEILQGGLADLDMAIPSDILLANIYVKGLTRAFILLREEAEDALEDLLKCQKSQQKNSEEE